MSALEVQKLSASYGDFQALFEVNLLADLGETIAIIGANGAGKSTLLNSIAGTMNEIKGAVIFHGQRISGLRPHDVVAKGIALIPEGRHLFSSLSVEENILIGGYCGRDGYWSLDSVYSLFPRLRERRKARATSLSGGEQQMAAFGRALMSNPALLMCDELSLGLAPNVIGEIYSALIRIKEQGTILLIVEQDIRQALAVADHVCCLQEGHMVLTGPPSLLSHEQILQAYFGM
jgi:branched-chain amino acid transport system ATP-binding protein